MDLRSIQYFVAIAREGGFARAGRQLNVNQPTLTRAILQLEDMLGAKLFHRSSRGTTLTEEGRRFLPLATGIVNDVGRARTLFSKQHAASVVTQVIVGLSPNLFHQALPEVLKDCLDALPDLAIVTQSGTIEQMLGWLRAREVDLVLTVSPTREHGIGRLGEGCTFEELYVDTMLPVAAPSHPLFDRPVTGEAVTRQDWAIPHRLSLSYEFEGVFYRRGLDMPRERLNTGSMALMLTAVRDWGLLGMLPGTLVTPLIAEGSLRVIDLPFLHFEYQLALILGASPTSAAERLAAMIRSRLAERTAPLIWRGVAQSV